jgi:pimeloyl-ACP methyl ester carboxylesterase
MAPDLPGVGWATRSTSQQIATASTRSHGWTACSTPWSSKTEIRALVSPFALLTPSGFRARSRVRPDELRQVAVPTLMVWGERDPLGGVSVAQAITDLIPSARLVVLPTGHGPWLGEPAKTAATIVDFIR